MSGCAGLIYQVSWERLLTLHSGVGIYSVAMIVAAFMAGLGLGSHAGGLLSTRLSARQALAAFAALETAIGVFGALSCHIFYDLLYLKASWLYSPTWRAGILHFLGLLFPTALMGMTLPFLVRATVRDVRNVARTVGFLYGINVLGASLGAWLAPWILIPHWGVRGAVMCAAVANWIAALTALRVVRSVKESAAARPVSAPSAANPLLPPSSPDQSSRRSLGLWLILYATSGYCALALEIVWFRLLDVGVKSTAFTFGTLLSLYLLGSGVGCLIGIPASDRFKRPLRVFLLCQCILLLYSGLAVVVLGDAPPNGQLYQWYFRYWGERIGFSLGEVRDLAQILRLYLLLPLFLFGIPTGLMGFSFTALQKAVHDDARTSGRKVGLLQAANIAGCVAGSLSVGLLSLAFLGSTGTVRVLMLVGAGLAMLGWREGRRVTFACLGCGLLLVAVAIPGQERLWRRLHGRGDSESVLVEEDATGVAAVVRSRSEAKWGVFANGTAQSRIPYGGIHTQLGAVAALVHPAPVDVAIVGLGSADTAWAAACRPQTRSVAVFEISGPQPRLLANLAAHEDIPELQSFLKDPRVRIRIADGRNAIGYEGVRYDLIEADALRPHAAGAGNLYSIEFFRLCANRLKPGGVMCTWLPTPRVAATFVRVFPHVLKSRSQPILIGSLQPLPVSPLVWRDRLDQAAVRDYLGPIGATIRRTLEGLRPPPEHRRFRRTDVNLDLFPRDEFMVQ